MPDPLTRFRPQPIAMMTELHDGTGVVLHLDTKVYFTLNATGVAVWNALAVPAGAAVPDVARSLSDIFEVDAAAAAADVESLIATFVAEGLVEQIR